MILNLYYGDFQTLDSNLNKSLGLLRRSQNYLKYDLF